jgi:hypothetical protein
MRRYATLLLAFGLLVVAGTASATPAAPGAKAGPDPFQLNLYETIDNTPGGAPTETPPAILLPETVVPGYLVLLEAAGTDPNNPLNWSDVVHFWSDATVPNSWAQLTSDIEGLPQGFDPVLIDQVLSSPIRNWIPETATPTMWRPGSAFPVDNEYFIWSDSPDVPDTPVPEPATLLLFGAGLIGAYGVMRRRRRG